MAISTNYSYLNPLLNPLSNSTAATRSTPAAPEAAATTLRREAGVEVTLSPAALEALAAEANKTAPVPAAQVSTRLRQVLSEVFLDNAKAAAQADKILPDARDAGRQAQATQATEYLKGDAANPFRGRAPGDLATVIVNAAGTYTPNERRAALSEFARQDAARIEAEITPASDFDRKVADAEVPASGKSDRLAQAKQATAFLANKGDNPFAGLDRDALTAVIDNDDGDYTVNERRAAMAERQRLEKGVLAELARPLSDRDKRFADAEKPAGNPDAARLTRAREATHFLDDSGDNPFAGLTRDELNAVVFEESGRYTANERRAAYLELKQYLPAATVAAVEKGEGTTEGEETSTPIGARDPYNTQGAYSPRLIRQILNAQAALSLLGVMNSGGGYGGLGGGTSGLGILA